MTEIEKKKLVCKRCHLVNISAYELSDGEIEDDMICVYCGGECEWLDNKKDNKTND